MKIIDSWVDENYNSTNKLYEFENRLKFLHVIKDGIKDFNIQVVIKAGSSFEDSLKVPRGTAHFLEHMFLKPNKVFKDLKAMDDFTNGSSTKAIVFCNAKTSMKFINFFTYGHENGALRMVEYLKYILDYPFERFQEFIENERGVIKSELKRGYIKEEKDSSLAYQKYVYSKTHPEFVGNVIGNEKSLDQITVKHLIKYCKKLFTSENTILTVQSSSELSNEILSEIKEISKLFKKAKNSASKILTQNIAKGFEYKHFKNDQQRDTFVSFSYHYPIQTEQHSIPEVNSWLIRNLLAYKGFDHLRNDLGYIYNMDTFKSSSLWSIYNEGFKFSFEKKNFINLFNEYLELIIKIVPDFIKSSDGKNWLESQLSKYIFTRTVNFDDDKNEEIAMFILVQRFYKDDMPNAKNYIKTITQEMFLKIYYESILFAKPKVWFVSPFEDEEVYDLFKSTKLFEFLEALK